MKLIRKAGKTSQTLNIFMADSSSTTGAGLTGLVFNSASLTAYYVRPGAAAVAITLVTQTVTGAWSSGGFVEISATNMPGWYRFDIPDACLAAGVDSVGVHFKGATSLAPLPIEIDLDGQVDVTAWNGTLLSTTNPLPNAAAGASGGVLISGSNSGTTTLGALTVTGALTVSDGIAVTRSSANSPAVSFTGNGSGNGFDIIAGATGRGLNVQSTTGDGFAVTVGSSGHGVNINGTGASKHGVLIAGGTSGTSDGLKLVAGSGGVGCRADTITVTGASTLTGTVTMAAGLTVTQSSANTPAVTITGTGTGAAVSLTGGATGQGLLITGGGTSGDGIKVTTTSGHGINLAPTGTSMHGMLITGGNGGTSDGLKLAAGTGGVGFRLDTLTSSGAITFNSFTTGAISATTITASGAVAFQSTFATTGTTTFNALTITNALTVSGATTLTGAWTATNAGNNVTGVALSAADSQAVPNGTGTATAGGGTSITLQTALGADSLPVGCFIKVTSGTGAGQERVITAYVNSTKVVTVGRAWVTSPDATSVYAIIYNDAPKIDSSLKVSGVVLTDTLTTYTSNTVQTGDSFARIGATGSGLTSLAPSATALSTAVWTAPPTGFLVATFPSGTVASTTNITAGTITTAANLTNAPTSGDFTATMKISLNAATPASVTGAVGSVTGSVGSIASGGIARASFAAETGLQTIRSNTAQAGAATTITLDASASAVDSFYNWCNVYLTGGTGAGQVREVLGYVGSTKVATVRAWTTNPDNTTTFAIAPAVSVWDEATASHLTGGSTGNSLNAAGSAGDPWGTALPGAYSAGTAGHIVGTALPDIAPGAANGLLRGGTNTATTFATLTSTGAFTVNGVSDVAQTGDSFARIGAAGAGLTSLGDTRIADLDTTVSSRASATVAPSWYTAPGTAPTVSQIATAVWQDATAGDFTTAGSIGKSLFTSGNAPGAASGIALVGSNMGAVTGVTGVTFPTSVASPTNITAALLGSAGNVAVADAVLGRNIAGGGSGTHTVGEALASIRNKVSIVGGVLTVYAADGTTPLWAANLTADGTAQPITVIAPTA